MPVVMSGGFESWIFVSLPPTKPARHVHFAETLVVEPHRPSSETSSPLKPLLKKDSIKKQLEAVVSQIKAHQARRDVAVIMDQVAAAQAHDHQVNRLFESAVKLAINYHRHP